MEFSSISSQPSPLLSLGFKDSTIRIGTSNTIFCHKTSLRSRLFCVFVLKLASIDHFLIADNDNREILVILRDELEDRKKVENKDLKDIYFDIIHDKTNGMDFVERFLEASSKYDSDAGKEEMETFSAVKRLHKANKIKKDKRGFVTVNGDQFLGTKLQDIATFCMNKDSIQYKIVSELVEELVE